MGRAPSSTLPEPSASHGAVTRLSIPPPESPLTPFPLTRHHPPPGQQACARPPLRGLPEATRPFLHPHPQELQKPQDSVHIFPVLRALLRLPTTAALHTATPDAHPAPGPLHTQLPSLACNASVRPAFPWPFPHVVTAGSQFLPRLHLFRSFVCSFTYAPCTRTSSVPGDHNLCPGGQMSQRGSREGWSAVLPRVGAGLSTGPRLQRARGGSLRRGTAQLDRGMGQVTGRSPQCQLTPMLSKVSGCGVHVRHRCRVEQAVWWAEAGAGCREPARRRAGARGQASMGL